MGVITGMLAERLFSWVFLGAIATACGGFPDIRSSDPVVDDQESLIERIHGYWVSAPDERSFFKNTARYPKTAFFFSQKNQDGDIEYRNLFSIEKTGRILLVQAIAEPKDDFEIVEDVFGKLDFESQSEPKINFNKKYLDSHQEGDSTKIAISIEDDLSKINLVVSGRVHPFYRTTQRKAFSLIRNPNFDFNPWEIFK